MSFRTIQHLWLIALFSLLVGGAVASAQSTTTSRGTLADSRAPLVTATQEFKAQTEQLVQLQEKEVAVALTKVDELRQLVTEGLVARVELQEREESLLALRMKLAATRQQIADAERMIAELQTADELAKSQLAAAKTASQLATSQRFTRPTAMRYSGSASWSLTSLPGIQSFFVGRFGRVLPTSAIGQSAIHNQLGYDHRNAVDVALHPDSIEGQTLLNYLRSQGIPFLAFRGPIPGVATGAHIHIGNPSHRLI